MESEERAKQIMGRIVASLREERLMSRYALAKRAGVDCSWLRRFEQGRSGVRVETLICIAQGLQIPASHIVDLIEMALCGAPDCPEARTQSPAGRDRQPRRAPTSRKDADLR